MSTSDQINQIFHLMPMTNYSFDYGDLFDFDLWSNHSETNYTSVDNLHPSSYPSDQRLFIFQIVNIILSFIIILTVIAFIVYLHIKQHVVAQKSPHFVPMLACCLVQLSDVIWLSFIAHDTLHNYSVKTVPDTCMENLIAQVIGNTLFPMISLLVAAVGVAESLRVQISFTLTWPVQKYIVMMLTFLSFMYGFIFLVPLFLILMLDDLKNPCYEGTNILNQRYGTLPAHIFNIFHFIVPSLFLLLSCGLIIVSYLSRRSSASVKQVGGYIVSYDNTPATSAQMTVPDRQNNSKKDQDTSVSFRPAGQPITGSSTDIPPTGTNNSPNSMLPPHQALSTPLLSLPNPTNTGNTSRPVQLTRPFPFNVVLAAAICIVFNIIFFLHMIDDFIDNALWMASSMTTIFVPVCWLLDSDIRAMWCCCCGGRIFHGVSSVSSHISGTTPQGEGQEILLQP